MVNSQYSPFTIDHSQNKAHKAGNVQVSDTTMLKNG